MGEKGGRMSFKGWKGKLFSLLNAILLFHILRKAFNTGVYEEKPEE